MDILTSISSKTLPFESHDHNMGVYREASFSSYLKGKDDNFIRKLSESTRYLNPTTIPAITATPVELLAGKNGGEDGEIGVFRAERYFNGGMDEEGSQRSTNMGTRKPVDQLVLRHHDHHVVDEQMKPKPWLGTPSIGSESTSTNSQSALLQSFLRNTAVTTAAAATPTITPNNYITSPNNARKKSVNGMSKSFLSSLGYCKCYSCKDEESVDVNEDVGEISFSNAGKPVTIKSQQKLDRLSNGSSFRESHFTFPTGSIMSPVKVVHFPEEEIERKSLEVFGSPVMGRLRNKSLSLEKRLAMLSWDNNSGGIYSNDDEINSDCSSDLFEIESLTNKAATFLAQSGCVTPTNCYAPSEASVEWSVVTASALDFDERRPSTTTIASPIRVINAPTKEVQKRRSSSLLGCNSQKAVKVADDAHKKKSDVLVGRRGSDSSAAVKRFEDETKVGGFSIRSQGPPHRALATLSLPRPYSPRLSNITFNTQ